MKLSIITVNLNNAKDLDITIRSIIEQTYCDYELIVIDGASSDGSIEVIKKYSANITYWISEPDKGIYNAMNKGIIKSTGEYCFFLNSGDWLYDKFTLEKVFEENTEESVIYGNIIATKDEVVRIEKFPGLSFGIFFTGSICHQSTFIKKILFTKYGFYDESFNIVADWKFFLITLILNNEQVKYIDINIAYHNLYGISMTDDKLFYQEREIVFKEFLPEKILIDYENYWNDILVMKRLKRYKLTKLLIWLLNRFTNRLERMAYQKERKKLNSIYKSRISELNY